ncbi:ABC-2 type transport system permease protein [Microbacterium sp. AK009]|uniref:ABC transporter permease n=1 Tax=Microbacterium sp. AK009 TaxID=2723068 RepID=UPI0015CEAE69|nr:ABC transporter permease [Microbacterium sp. AK009]NYF15848.1 ABC-2 type transport system permease protein [Microbacterium sp. AK009]
MSEAPDSAALARYARLEAIPLRPVGASTGLNPRDWWTSLRELFARREMLDLLVRRDLKAKYKDSTLGFFWSLARPIMLLAIYFVVVGQFLGAARGIPDFGIYIFTGLTAIGLFTEIVVSATGAIVVNSGLVKKVYVPRELFPLASVGSALFNFAVQFTLLLGVTVIAGAFPWHPQILYLIPSFLVLLVYGTALGLLFSALNVYLRDIQYLVEVGTMLLFWASPVVYSWQMASDIIASPVLLSVFTNNPLTLAVIGFQEALWLGADSLSQPDNLLLRLLIALGVGVVLLLVSHRAFLRLQGNFAQEL